MPSEVQRKKQSKVSKLTISKAVLIFGFADFCLVYVVNNHRLSTS